MIVTKHIILGGFAAAMLLCGRQAAHADLYRYTNKDGFLEVSTQIPTEYVKNGYEVVDHNGTIVRVVEPQLSPEEYAVREAEREAKRRYDESVRRVFTLYASEEDIQAAERMSIESIERSVAEAKGDIARLQNEKLRLEEQAALQERSGRATPADTIRYLNALEKRLEDRQRDVETRSEEIEKVRVQFENDRQLFREVSRTRYDARR